MTGELLLDEPIGDECWLLIEDDGAVDVNADLLGEFGAWLITFFFRLAGFLSAVGRTSTGLMTCFVLLPKNIGYPWT